VEENEYLQSVPADEESQDTKIHEEDVSEEESIEEKSVEQLLAEKEEESKDNYDKWLRALAEFDNYKKRQEREKADFCKFAMESLMKELLPVLDNLDRALEHSKVNEVPQSFIEGLELARKSFWDVLDKNGLKHVDAVGEKFDPNYHEAIMQQDDPDSEENTILTEVQKGYLLHDRLIRPSMVVVSKKPAGEEKE